MDTVFLREQGLMDYSLNFVVEVNSLNNGPSTLKSNQLKRNEFMSLDRKEIYHLGIIDYLQTWNSQKKAESCLKRTFFCRQKQGLSAVMPKEYADRFLLFSSENVFKMHSDYHDQ